MLQKNVLILLLMSTVLASCGGGSGEEAKEEVVLDTPKTDPVAEDSTKLSDHALDASNRLNMFKQFTLTVDLNQADMDGNYRFLKVEDSFQNTLFLGQVALSGSIELPIDVSKSNFPVQVEIFSELASDTAVSYEVDYE